VNAHYHTFPEGGGIYASKLALSIEDVRMFGSSGGRPWKTVLCNNHPRTRPRDSSARALKLEVEVVFGFQESASEIVSSRHGSSEIVSSMRHGCTEIVSSTQGVSKIASEVVSSSHGISEFTSKIVSSLRHGCSKIGSYSHGFSEIASSLHYARSKSSFSHRPCLLSLPSWIPMSNLRVLEIVGCESQLETLWNSDSQTPLELRELNITMNL
jgi:hypothetical protein